MSNEKILVVEDEDAILMLLEDDLSVEGYEVEKARDGERAVAMARDGRFDRREAPNPTSSSRGVERRSDPLSGGSPQGGQTGDRIRPLPVLFRNGNGRVRVGALSSRR